MIRSALRSRRGAAAALVAVAGIVLIGFAGFALDLTRAYMVSARLKTSVDAAALLAAREMDISSRDADATALFWANYRRNQPAGSNYLGSNVTSFVITKLDANRIQVSGTATVATTLFNVIAGQSVTVSEVSVATRQTNGLELAVVLDQTSSMRGTKLSDAITAVHTMIDILYGPSADTIENMRVSVVPFSRTINFGNTAVTRGWLNTTNMPPGWDSSANFPSWSGCVEARYSGGYDLVETPPVVGVPASQFRPYYYPITTQRVGTATTQCTNANSYTGTPRYCEGDNDVGQTNTNLDGNAFYAYLRNAGMARADSASPNLLCNLTPVLPLTASRTAVLAHVDSITAPIRSGGTAIAPGLQGAWYTLSPSWQGTWGLSSYPNGNTAPVPYNTRNMQKAIVILSDGDNNWQTVSGYSSGNVRSLVYNSSGVLQNTVTNEQLYSAYGRAWNWNNTVAGQTLNLPSSTFPAALNPYFTSYTPATFTVGNQTGADLEMDRRTAALCANIKEKGILIYVVGFEVASQANRVLLQTCSSGDSFYFESPTSAQLNAAFTQVANSLSSLRLSE